MSLTRKLLSAFGGMLAVLLVLSGAGLMVTRALNRDLDSAANITARRQYLAGEVSTASSDMTGSERGVVLSAMLGKKDESDAYQQRFRERAAEMQRALAELHGSVSSRDDEAGLLDTLDRQCAQLLQSHEQLSQAMAGQQMDAAMGIFGRC